MAYCTHAIEDGNVLRFHVDYYKPEGEDAPRPGESLAKKAIVEAILDKHDAATGSRRFNALSLSPKRRSAAAINSSRPNVTPRKSPTSPPGMACPGKRCPPL